jgi:hypothetical protein
MVTKDPDPAALAFLGTRLQTLRQQRFVGRGEDLALFREALESDDPSFAVLYVHGPGGVGKTTLLDAFARQALEKGCAVVRVDGRAVEPSPDGFARALDLHPGIRGGSRLVVMIDTYEHLSSLDGWLRDTFLPGLPGDTLVVIAGRNPPSAAWRLDLGWGHFPGCCRSGTSRRTMRCATWRCGASRKRRARRSSPTRMVIHWRSRW